MFALSTTLPPEQKDVAPPAEMVAAGAAVAVTCRSAEVVLQPLLVTITEYNPLVEAA